VSGSRTATLPVLPLELVDELPLLVLLLLLQPHPATAKARAVQATAIPATKPGERLLIGEPPPPGVALTPGSFAARRAGCWFSFVRSCANHTSSRWMALTPDQPVGFGDHERERTEGLGASAELAGDDVDVARRARD